MYYELDALASGPLSTSQRALVDSLRRTYRTYKKLTYDQQRLVKKICAEVAVRPRHARVLAHLLDYKDRLSPKHAKVVDDLCQYFDKHGSLTVAQFQYACGIADAHTPPPEKKTTTSNEGIAK